MITSSSISYISEMLEQPQNLTEVDVASIKELTQAFPYFVPARYMQAAQEHKDSQFAPEMVNRMQLFSGNWMFYNQFLQDSIGGKEVEFTTVHEAAPVIEEEPIVNEVVADEPIFNTTATDVVEEVEEEEAPVNTGFIRGKKKDKPVDAKQEEAQPQPDEAVTDIIEEPIAEPSVAEATEEIQEEEEEKDNKENLIPPIYTEDYFLHQGLHVSNELPEDIIGSTTPTEEDEEQALMVVMSFSDWLMFYKKKKQQEEEEEQDQRELKSMWQKQKLAAAMEEENEEIPENVFEMAVNSISNEDNLVSESLAQVMVKQGRYDRAVEMYKKLSLLKPQKKAYFARKIEDILKEQ